MRDLINLNVIGRAVVMLIPSMLFHEVSMGQSFQNEQLLKKVARVTAQVSEVWIKDERYTELHKELNDNYSGTPPLDVFLRDEQWVTVVSWTDPYFPGIFKGRGKTSMDLRKGDVVEMRTANHPKKVSSYNELGEVLRVICKSGSENFEKCSQENPLGWFGKDGEKVELLK